MSDNCYQRDRDYEQFIVEKYHVLVSSGQSSDQLMHSESRSTDERSTAAECEVV